MMRYSLCYKTARNSGELMGPFDTFSEAHEAAELVRSGNHGFAEEVTHATLWIADADTGLIVDDQPTADDYDYVQDDLNFDADRERRLGR